MAKQMAAFYGFERFSKQICSEILGDQSIKTQEVIMAYLVNKRAFC
jgi:hypothetical protein